MKHRIFPAFILFTGCYKNNRTITDTAPAFSRDFCCCCYNFQELYGLANRTTLQQTLLVLKSPPIQTYRGCFWEGSAICHPTAITAHITTKKSKAETIFNPEYYIFLNKRTIVAFCKTKWAFSPLSLFLHWCFLLAGCLCENVTQIRVHNPHSLGLNSQLSKVLKLQISRATAAFSWDWRSTKRIRIFRIVNTPHNSFD